jgi:N-acetylmuramoyl-L-alanine amidase
MEPLPQGAYSIGAIEFKSPNSYEAVWNEGLGPVWIAITPKFKTGRSALGLHVDGGAIGTAGCLAVQTMADLRVLVWWMEKYKPAELVCDWGVADKPKAKRVLLDPGHSEGEPGARSNDDSAEEEDLARLQASTIQKALQDAGHVCDIYDPMVDDLSDIGRKAEGYDLFLSLHFNSYDGNKDPGTEVFVLPGADATNRKFATAILEGIVKALGSTNRGVKEANWKVIRVADQYCKGPALLIESFFLNAYSAGAAGQRATVAGGAIAKAVVGLLS